MSDVNVVYRKERQLKKPHVAHAKDGAAKAKTVPMLEFQKRTLLVVVLRVMSKTYH